MFMMSAAVFDATIGMLRREVPLLVHPSAAGRPAHHPADRAAAASVVSVGALLRLGWIERGA